MINEVHACGTNGLCGVYFNLFQGVGVRLQLHNKKKAWPLHGSNIEPQEPFCIVELDEGKKKYYISHWISVGKNLSN